MAPIFFLVRLPVFLVAISLYAVFATIVGGGFWLLWGAWLTFKIPFQFIGKFLSAAFSNDSRKLSDWRWQQQAWEDWGSAAKGYFNAYGDLLHWLAYGSK